MTLVLTFVCDCRHIIRVEWTGREIPSVLDDELRHQIDTHLQSEDHALVMGETGDRI